MSPQIILTAANQVLHCILGFEKALCAGKTDPSVYHAYTPDDKYFYACSIELNMGCQVCANRDTFYSEGCQLCLSRKDGK